MNAGCHVHVQHTAAFLHMLLEENHKIDQSLEGRFVGLAPWKVPIQPPWQVGFLPGGVCFSVSKWYKRHVKWWKTLEFFNEGSKYYSIFMFYAECDFLKPAFWKYTDSLQHVNIDLLWLAFDRVMVWRMLVYVGHLFVSCCLFGDVGRISKHVSNLFYMRCWQYGRQVLLKDYVLFQPGTSCRSSWHLNIINAKADQSYTEHTCCIRWTAKTQQT